MEKIPAVTASLELSRLRRASRLFKSNGRTDVLVTNLEGLGAELSNRAMAIGNAPGLAANIQEYGDRAKKLSSAVNYASDRLGEVLARLRLINWLTDALSYQTPEDLIAQVSDPKVVAWRTYMGLAVKDFHTDLGSLMDALAPVVTQTERGLGAKQQKRPPGWSDLSGDESNARSSKYRALVPQALLDIVDETKRWWPPIKSVRDIMTHREHDRIVFGNSEDGLLFQIYDRSRTPKIVLPQVLYSKGYNVVDFGLYSAFIVAEFLTLFDDIGNAIAKQWQISRDMAAQMSIRIVEKPVRGSIRRLIKLAKPE
ncbi:hypothetical protein ACFLUU_07970 [Chloroflexota bacterium]